MSLQTLGRAAMNASGWSGPDEGLLSARMAPPRHGEAPIARKALLDRITETLAKPFIHVRAPVGYGKTTLLTQVRKLVLARGASAGWVSLEAGDNDIRRFLAYLGGSFALAGCSVMSRDTVAGAGDMAQSSGEIATRLLNRIHDHGTDVYLFLDDFHCITAEETRDFVATLIRYAPPNFHVVMSSRSAAPFQLPDLRIRGRMAEFDHADLKFAVEDTHALLQARIPSAVPSGVAHCLQELTDGWVAPLRYAAATLSRRAALWDAAGTAIDAESLAALIDDFMADMFSHLPAEVATFVLRTSVLERVNAAVCAEVADAPGAAELLARIETENVVLLPHREDGGWLSYHRLFSHCLQRFRAGSMRRAGATAALGDADTATALSVLVSVEPEVRQLHRRARDWFERQGQTVEAARHAFAAGDVDAGLDLAERCAMDLVRQGRAAMLLGWLDRVPARFLAGRDQVLVALRWARILCGRREARSGDPHAPAGIAHADAAMSDFGRAVAHGLRALYRYDSVAAGAAIADRPSDGDPWHVNLACIIAAFSDIHAGRVYEAIEILGWSKRFDPLRSSPPATAYGNVFLALAYERMENPAQAECIYRAGLFWAERFGGRLDPSACLVAAMWSESLYLANRLDELDNVLANRLEVIAGCAYPEAVVRAWLSRVRLLQQRGFLDQAFDQLGELRVYGQARSMTGIVVVALAESARLWLRQGRLDAACKIQDQIDAMCPTTAASPSGSLAELQLHARISRVRVRIALGQFDAAAAEAASVLPLCSAIPALRVTALILHAASERGRGRHEAAAGHFLTALRVGERTGNLRGFLDERDMIHTFAELVATDATSEGLAHMKKILSLDDDYVRPATGVDDPRRSASELVLAESLSRREREILGLLSEGMPNKRIALCLNVSVETVKWHLKNLYGKLQVTDRYNAAQRGRRLGVCGVSAGAAQVTPAPLEFGTKASD